MVVTGGFGFVGSSIVTALIDHFPNCDIIILDKATSPTRPTHRAGVKSIQVDLTSATDVKSAFEEARPEFVIHTAGYVPPPSKRYSRVLEKVTKDVNVAGTRHVLDAALAVGCRGMVYTSSCCAVMDDMKDYAHIDERWPLMIQGLVYGESKVEAEKIVMSANSDTFGTCVLRPAVIFGEVSGAMNISQDWRKV
jgi:sterol-4alpha-carboxylate 3-dehydrogenase (decarboxylating)